MLPQDRARGLSELRRLEAEVGEATRNLKGAQGDEEALRSKAMHLRDDIDRAELARDKALAAHDRAVAVRCCCQPEPEQALLPSQLPACSRSWFSQRCEADFSDQCEVTHECCDHHHLHASLADHVRVLLQWLSSAK